MCCFFPVLPSFITRPPIKQFRLPLLLIKVKQSLLTHCPEIITSWYSSTNVNASSMPSSIYSSFSPPLWKTSSTTWLLNCKRQKVSSSARIIWRPSSDQITCFIVDATSILLMTENSSQSQNVMNSLLLIASKRPPKIPSFEKDVLNVLNSAKFWKTLTVPFSVLHA